MEQDNSGNLHLIEDIENCVIHLLDNSGVIIGQSKNAQKLIIDKFSRVSPSDIIEGPTNEDQEEIVHEELIADAISNGAVTYEGWNTREDGSHFFCKIVITALYDKSDILSGFYKQTCIPAKSSLKLSKLRMVKANHNEFEQSNLFALINNTQDLMWSVDRNYKLITSNKSFDDMMQQMIGKSIAKGSDVLAIGFSNDQLVKYKKLYARAFSGETFKIIEYTQLPIEFWSELSFHPIRRGAEVMGTACYSRDITDQKIAEQKIIHTHQC